MYGVAVKRRSRRGDPRPVCAFGDPGVGATARGQEDGTALISRDRALP